MIGSWCTLNMKTLYRCHSFSDDVSQYPKRKRNDYSTNISETKQYAKWNTYMAQALWDANNAPNTHQNVRALILGTWAHLTLYDKREVADMIMVKELEIESACPEGPNRLTRAHKIGEFFSAEDKDATEEKTGNLWCMRKTICRWYGSLKMEKSMNQSIHVASKNWTEPQLTASEVTGTSVLQHKEVNSANNLNEQGKWIIS